MSKRRHEFAVTLSFTPCVDRQTDFYKVSSIELVFAKQDSTSLIHIYVLIDTTLYFSLLFPDESTRVQLTSVRGLEGSDYINASFIDVSCLSLLLLELQ